MTVTGPYFGLVSRFRTRRARRARELAAGRAAGAASSDAQAVEELRLTRPPPCADRAASRRRNRSAPRSSSGDCSRQTTITTAALNTIVAIGRDADRVDRRDERLDDQGADERADERELAAGERRAADDDREDRVELDEQAGVVGVGRRRCSQLMMSPAMPAQNAQNDVDDEDDARAPARRPGGWPPG